MNDIHREEYRYQVGGSLSPDDPTYVIRKADQELLDTLKVGEFCYVLKSRQMGKSSLRVRTMQLLRRDNFACAAIDLTKLGSNQLTADQWYKGIVVELARGFNLLGKFDLKGWRNEQQELSAVQQLGLFLEDILLAKVNNDKIFVFVDEIDSILSLNFPTDDFFALIRFCYEQRVVNPGFNRLTFCLFGVATPSDLISDKKRTPFNIGRAISLDGFQFYEAESLAIGLMGRAANPHQLLKEVLDWTGGQPFLTQKICNLIVKSSFLIPEGGEAECINNLVLSHVLDNWEAQDVPEHFRTIRDRILSNEKIASRLLGLYQKILAHGEITANDRPDQVRLQLSGLVVEEQGKLKVYNRIYEAIFDHNWTKKAIASLRPYTRSLAAWLNSDCQDESRLLRGNALRDALAWAADKSLSNQDHQFLAASQKSERELERLEAEIKLETEKQENQILAEAYEEANLIKNKAQKKAKRMIQVGLFILILMLFISVITVVKAKIRDANSQLRNQSTISEVLFASNLDLESLQAGLSTAKQLKQLKYWGIVEPETQAQVTVTLRQLVYGIKEQNRLEVHGNPITVWRVVFSPDGEILASGSDDKTVRLWSRDGTLLKTLLGHQSEIWAVSFSPDSQILASGSSDGVVKLWDRNGKLLKTLIGHTNMIPSINFSPDSQILATASADKTVKLWRSDGTLLKILKGHEDKVNCVIFSPDGQMLATGSNDKTVKLWKRDGTLVASFSGHTGGVWTVTFSSNGQMLASGGVDKMVKLWSRSGNLLATFSTDNGHVEKLTFSPHDQSIISGNESNTVNIWKLDGTPIQAVTKLGTVVNTDINFNPDGKTLATTNYDGTVRIFSFSSNPLKTLNKHVAAVLGVDFSPDGQNILTTSWDGTAKLWKRDGSLLRTISLTEKGDNVWRAIFSPDSQSIAANKKDNTVNIWKRDGTLLKNITRHSTEILGGGVSFSPNGKTLVTAGQDGIIRIWDRDGNLLKVLKAHDAPVHRVAFSPDGQIIASASGDKTAKLWRIDGTLIKTLKGHNHFIRDISFSPDGQIISTASSDGTAKLWLYDGSLLTTLKGHSSVVYGVTFSPDSHTIATASGDKTVRLWSRNGSLLATLVDHNGRVFDVSFSPDGKTLASASEDKTVILWNLDLDDLMVRGCQWLHDYLKTNPNLSESDRHICDGIEPSK
jgi:WD40 repeat protein